MPSRLVAVQQNAVSGGFQLSLVDVSHRVKYAALSYCWGVEQPQKTTKTNMKPYYTNIDHLSLPKTIQDAILATHKLGLSFLWVDSLCIIQDDDVDISSQMKIMGGIYRGAYLTISASIARSSNEGFLHSKTDMASQDPWHSISVRKGNQADGRLFLTPITFSRQPHVDSPLDEPINERAWTLQESLLSSRVLYYGSRQVFWRCHEKSFSDGGLNADYFHRDVCFEPGGLSTDFNPTYTWPTIVETYTKRTLTMPNDKLSAISAIAQEINNFFQPGDVYLAGMWKSTFCANLVWCVQPTLPRPLYRAPSWSWASVDGTVSWRFTSHLGAETCTLVQSHISLVDNSLPYGPVSFGYVVVKGKTKNFQQNQLSTLAGFSARWDCEEDHLGPHHSVCLFEVYPVSLWYDLLYAGLILADMDTTQTYRRVGCYQVRRDSKQEHKEWNAGFEWRTVKIV
jgi:hypothetical protein